MKAVTDTEIKPFPYALQTQGHTRMKSEANMLTAKKQNYRSFFWTTQSQTKRKAK